MVDEAAELDVLEKDDRELIHSIFDWGDTVAREVMIPRTDMVTIDARTTIDAAMRLFLARALSRVPVRAGDADEIVGVLHLRDVARVLFERPEAAATTTAAELARPALFVPDSKKADDTLRQMQLEANHLAMVVDEYGGIAGLVTLEDLIEELVGDISDESDRGGPEVERLRDDAWLVSARLSLDELGDLVGTEIEDEDVDSVGGLLTKTIGRLPKLGDVAHVAGLVLTADRTDGRRRGLTRVLVERDPAAASPEDEEAATKVIGA
jgi:CBS domain containing-hemolysin-like protein